MALHAIDNHFPFNDMRALEVGRSCRNRQLSAPKIRQNRRNGLEGRRDVA
jgi:hypothetical protein